MPTPSVTPTAAWEVAETKEMEDVIGLYGKTYHFWEADKGDKLPMGQPKLMMSLTSGTDLNQKTKDMWADRDERFGIDSGRKKEKRGYIQNPEIHPGRYTAPNEPRILKNRLTL